MRQFIVVASDDRGCLYVETDLDRDEIEALVSDDGDWAGRQHVVLELSSWCSEPVKVDAHWP